jgi:hypothetical protein
MFRRLITFVAMVFVPVLASAQKIHYVLRVPSFVCYQTTEDGQDEIYLLITWKTTTGREGNFFKGVWQTNDTGHQDNNYPMGTILDIFLDPGEIMEVLGTVMEQDDGQPRQYESVGRSILNDIRGSNEAIFPYSQNASAEMSDKIKGLLASSAQAQRLDNSDDWIGSFSFRVPDVKVNQQPWAGRGIFNWNSAPANTNTYYNDGTTGALLAVFNFGGDGSKYTLKIAINQSNK